MKDDRGRASGRRVYLQLKMDVSAYLREHGAETRQIVFDGEPFTALNVARLRERVLGEK